MSIPTITEQLVRIQSEVTTGDAQAFFEKSATVDGFIFKQPWESVSWNASDKSITVDGNSLTYGQVMQYVVAIAIQERIQQAEQAALNLIEMSKPRVVE